MAVGTAVSAEVRPVTWARKFVKFAKSPSVGDEKVSTTLPAVPVDCTFGVPGLPGSVRTAFDAADGDPSP